MKKAEIICLFAVAAGVSPVGAQVLEPLPFGDMDRWMTREVEESFVIGGKTRYIYELAEGDTLRNNTPYQPDLTVSPWATSSVLAKVSGVVKSSTTVFPEKRGDGYAARLETRIERVKVLGIVNISVLAAGTLFLGEITEPVRDTKDPQAKLMMGIPFTKRPQSLVFDYKFRQGEENGKRLRISAGFGRDKVLPGTNCAEVCLLLQKRWEDADGLFFSKRVGTAWVLYDKSTGEGINDHTLPILYGDITNDPSYQPYMGLINDENQQYCQNSKGERVPIQEVGWAEPDEQPTHLVLRFSSSHGGAYIGAPGSTFWIDNVRLGYAE